MAELPSNPVPFEVIEDVDVPPRTGIEILVYPFDDPFTVLDVVPRRTNPQSLDEVEGPGGGSFQIFRDDAKLIETPNLLDYRNVFKTLLDGEVIGAFVNTNKRSDFVSRDERAGEFWECSGGGLRTWLHDAVVEPYGGIRTDSQAERVFSFASEQGSWYKPDDWDAPAIVQQYNMDPNGGPFGTAPAEWPDVPDANWIWGAVNTVLAPAPEGINYFRCEFDILEDVGFASYSVFAAAREDFDVFIDGQRVIESRETNGYARTWRADFELAPGHHILAARVHANGVNPAGLIASLFRAGVAVEETAAVLITYTRASDWKVNAYPDPAPGWTPGEIMLTLLDEAEARGVRFPTWLTPTFTAEADSDGVEWSRALDWSFSIGTEYYDIVEKLEELVCDLWINPATYELSMWGERGSHRDAQSLAAQPVKFEVARNVVRASAEGTSDIKNTLLMNTTGGWTLISDAVSDSVAKYGRVEGFVSTGASPSVSGDVAQKVFKGRAVPETSATYDVIDVDGSRPFIDFFVGDWVLAPSEANEITLVPRRVMSISVSENSDTGAPEFAIEFDTITEDRARRYERWLQTTSDGTLGGTLANVSGGGGGASASPNAQNTQTGPQGLQGPQGTPGFHYMGVWDSGEDYAISDVVSWEGTYWVAHTPTSEEPGDSADDWDELVVAPTTTPTVGAMVALLANYSAPIAATAIPWTQEIFKNGVAHAANSSDFTIMDTGAYLISGEFYTGITAGNAREFQLQVNGVTVMYARSHPLTQATTNATAYFSGVLLQLNAGDIVRVTSTGTAIHTLGGGTQTWFSIAGISGAQGDQGPQGDNIVWTGPWITATSYQTLDLVENDGSSYTCIANHTSGASTEPGVGVSWATAWELAAQKGAQGEPGLVGAPGDPGVVYEGTWEGGVTYQPNDLVSWENALWIAVSESTNKEPGVEPEWEEFSLSIISPYQYLTMAGASGDGVINLSESFRFVWITATAPCRVRFYRSAADRIADAARPADQEPAIQGLVLGEFSFPTGGETYWSTGFINSLTEGAYAVYYRVDGGPSTVNICWVRVTNFIGPTGPEGPSGEEGPEGPEGPTGPAGPGLVIIGTLSDETELPGSGDPGDAYLIDGYLWIWSTLLSDWENVGPMSAGGGGFAAGNFVKTTGTIVALEHEIGMFPMNDAEVQQVLQVNSDRRARLRLYASTAHRAADINRAPSQDPIGDHGVLLDVVLDDGILSLVQSPSQTVFNIDGFPGEFPYTITNLDPAYTGPITVTVLSKGMPGVAQGGSDVADYVKTTASLANGASESGTFSMSWAEVHYGLKLSADKACRVRFYATTAQRTADLTRPVGTDPTGNHGLLWEVVLPVGSLTRVALPPAVLFASSGFGPVPVTITNMSGSTGAVAVTLTAKGV